MSMSEESAQMPAIEAETVVLAQNAPSAGKDAQKPQMPVKSQPSEIVGDYVKPSLIRYANYDYQTGTTFFLSKTQQIVVDAYLKTNNVAEACRALNAIRGAHGSTRMYTPNAVSRWLRKPLVARYIGEKFMDKGKVNWMNPEKWEAWGIDVMQGKIDATTVQAAVWKEYGKSKGWYKENQPVVQNNTQINFVQSDGRA